MKKSIFISILLFLFIFSPLYAATPIKTPIDIDLINAQYQGHYLFDLSRDELTDIIGRPSSGDNLTKSKDLNIYLGSILNYYEKGISFWFTSADLDNKETCANIHIYLIKTYDEKNSDYFLPYQGNISNLKTDNLKKKNVFEVFSKYNPVDKYSEEEKEKLDKDKSVYGESTYKVLKENLYAINIDFKKYYLFFKYDPLSDFITDIMIVKKNVAVSK